MRLQLQRLSESGVVVRFIDICGEPDGPLRDDRWLYCGEAETLFCGCIVAKAAAQLWPKAEVRTVNTVIGNHRIVES